MVHLNRCVALAASFVACAPSIDSAAKADIDRRIAAMQVGERSLGAPTAPQALDPAVGQWATYKLIDKDGKPSFMTYKIVGQEGDAFWMETTNETYYGRSSNAMLMVLGNRMDPATMEIRNMKSKDKDGTVTEYSPAVLSMMKSMWKSVMLNIQVSWLNLPQESTEVVAGRFSDCYKTQQTVEFAGYSNTSDVWLHSAVPLWGLVRSQGVSEPTVMELVDFGSEGAVSDF